MPGFSLISASGLVEPANTLVNKISNAIGRHFNPRQEVRMAEAAARADHIRRVGSAEIDIEIAELKDRAAYRFANEEMTKQLNMEGITDKAIPRLTSDASPDSMENDWITNFFDKCRTVSDDDMQELWGRILAGEANTPNSFSRRTVNLVADLDKRDAELLTRLCAFGWMIGGLTPLVFDLQADIYNRNGIAFDTLGRLEELGLIHLGGVGGFQRTRIPKKAALLYYDRPLVLEFPNDDDNKL